MVCFEPGWARSERGEGTPTPASAPASALDTMGQTCPAPAAIAGLFGLAVTLPPQRVPFCLHPGWCRQRWGRSQSHTETGVIAGGGMWQPPYRFLSDERGHSADRVVNIQQRRRLGEARAGFSSLQGRKEAQQGRAGHSSCPPSTALPSAPAQAGAAQLLKGTHPQGADLPPPGQSLRWRCGIPCSTARPFTNPSWGAKLLCRE